ncbi:MAG: PQQ-dependent sugar dehydrogenase [Elusimicrobia bacterium]|nr:PQQ-dependent sugar dehydrogenase [Elusimicrobiota bacterium]
MLFRLAAVWLCCLAAAGAAGPFSDWRSQRPGARHLITPADLPPPLATPPAVKPPRLVRRPPGAWPRAPEGFKVELYARSARNPRLLRVAPNGDLFVAESAPGRIRVFRGVGRKGRAARESVFARGLDQPFGIAFYPPGPEPRFVYVAEPGAVVRFPYRNGELKASAPGQRVLELPGGGLLGGGHWTRDLAFSTDAARMFVSVGSFSNDEDTDKNPREFRRADILACDPEGKGLEVFAWGLRDPVSLAVRPGGGELWTSVNERDDLGDDLPPDFLTRVKAGGFYGWPWYYIGPNPDPRYPGRHMELKDRVLVPDVLVQPHAAPLQIAFYEGGPFPARYRGGLFAALHGSWNRSRPAGYEVIFVPFRGAVAEGGYEDFLTFITPEGWIWARPAGVAVGTDGSMYVSDDGSNSVWRVVWAGP